MQVGHLGLNFSRPSTLQRALASTSGAQVYARFDNLYGAGGLYYSESAIKTFADVIANGPAGEPTSAGMLVNGSDAPTLVQGSGPVPHPGYSGTEHTVKVEWDADGVTGDRVVCEIRKDANNRIPLHFVSGILRLESFVAGSSEGFVAVAGVDDGGSHSAVLYWDEVSGTLSLDVDGQGLEGPEMNPDPLFGAWTDSTVPDGWTKVGTHNGSNYLEESPSGSLHMISDGTYIGVILPGFVPGMVYQSEYTGVVNTSGRFDNTIGAGTTVPIVSGDSTVVTVATYTNFLLKRANVTDASIAGLSVKATYTRSGLTLPTNLSQIALGHSGGANQLNGYVLELAAANGNQAWA